MTTTINGTTGITLPSGSAAVGTTDSQTLTNKTIGSGYAGSTVTAGTAVASTSGTSIDFTGIPSWVKRITVMFNGVSTNGTSGIDIKIGYSGGIESTGYSAGCSRFSSAGSSTVGSTTAFFINTVAAATDILGGSMVITNVSGNIWSASSTFGCSGGSNLIWVTAGNKTLTGVLDRVRISTTNGTDTFDAGSINILYE